MTSSEGDNMTDPVQRLQAQLDALRQENRQLKAQLASDNAVPSDERALLNSQQERGEIKELYSTLPLAMALYDTDLRFIRINERLAEINGVSVDEHIGRRCAEVLPEIGEFVESQLAHVRDTGEAILGYEIAGTTPANPDKQHVWEADWYPVKHGGQVVAVGASVRDVTKQRMLEDDLRRAMRELQHRVKNILANVGALVRQAKRSSASSDEKLDILSARIKSLAKTHEVLTAADWKDTPLSKVVEAELLNVYGRERVFTQGPDIALGPRATLAFAMAFHELATNAAKYGSLSQENGYLDLRWQREDDDPSTLVLVWREFNGPRIKQPSGSGFGTSLINHSITKSLGGALEREFGDDGLRCVFRIPLSQISDKGNADAAAHVDLSDPFSGG